MLLVNLFAGPGAGKSTTCSQAFSIIKGHGVCAEMALEFAKDLTWEGRYGAMSCQPYIFGEQLWRLERLRGAGVDVILTDSPILLSDVYGRHLGWESLGPAVLQAVRSFPNRLNYVLARVKSYDPRGRRQSEASARSIDTEVEGALLDADEPYKVVPGSELGARKIAEDVLKELSR